VNQIVVAINPVAVSTETAARLCEVSADTIEREINDGKIAFVRIRGKRRIAVSELTRYIQENREEA
jgi:excisionase family DNA binding protein